MTRQAIVAWTPEIEQTICDRIAEGESLRSICRDEAMPGISTVQRRLRDDAAFADTYARAREQQMEVWADDIVEIADDKSQDSYEGAQGGVVIDREHIQRSKLRVETRQWLMGRIAPKKYGIKTTQEITGPGGGPVGVLGASVSIDQYAAARKKLIDET